MNLVRLSLSCVQLTCKPDFGTFLMKFGLFGGAILDYNSGSEDSLGYEPFMDVVLEAESLGFQSNYLVEHENDTTFHAQ